MDDTVSQLLRELDSKQPFALLDVLDAHLGTTMGARAVRVWLVDYGQECLSELVAPGRSDDGGRSVPVSSGGPAVSFRSQRSGSDRTAGGTAVYSPLTVRAERIGVLEVVLAAPPGAEEMRALESTARLIAYVLLGARRYTDVFERARRRREMEVPAELQWELLPVLAHDGPHFAVAGAVEPSYDIGGDSFDYAVGPDGVWVAITDAMGHGMRAALLASLCAAVFRNGRRQGQGPRQLLRAADVAVHDEYGGEAFVTALVLRVDRKDGRGVLVNAGHSYALLLRGGAVEPLAMDADLPLGLFGDAEYRSQPFSLTPGDRLLLFTDGVLEAATEDGVAFGDARLSALLRDTSGERPGEAVRLLTRAVMEHRGGGPLLDDVTAVCLDYRRPQRSGGWG